MTQSIRQTKQFELRRYTKTTGGIGERVFSGSLKACLQYLYGAITINKYEYKREHRLFTILSSPYGKQTKQFWLKKVEG